MTSSPRLISHRDPTITFMKGTIMTIQHTSPASGTNQTATGSTPLPLSLARVVAVEGRKLIDTRAGRALIGAAVAGVGLFAGGRAAFPTGGTDLGDLATMAMWPGGLGLMVLALLLVTSEFSGRTASVTFTLDPRRGRVLAAKVSVVVAMVLVVSVLALAAGALMVLVVPPITGEALGWGVDPSRLAAGTGANLVSALAGLAWGLVFRNAPAPIVVLLAWPTLSTLVGAVSPTASEATAYLSLEPTFALVAGEPAALPKLVTSVAFWVILPGLVGTRRLLRTDLT